MGTKPQPSGSHDRHRLIDLGTKMGTKPGLELGLDMNISQLIRAPLDRIRARADVSGRTGGHLLERRSWISAGACVLTR